MQSGELVSIDSTMYMYINEDMGWAQLTSNSAAKKIADGKSIYYWIAHATWRYDRQ